MNPDSELLQRYAATGDEAAFAAFVHHHINLVYATALRVANGDAALAEDAAQSVFTDLARKAGRLSGHATLAGWLHTSARFAAAKAVRAERTRRAREQEAAAMSDPIPSHDPAWSQLRPLIDEAIGQLRETERNALLLRFFEDKSHREVGDALGLNENAARMRIDRALEKLRRFFSRRGVATTTALLGAALGAQAAGSPAPAGLAASVAGKSMAAAGAGLGAGLAVRWRYALAGAAGLGLLAALGYTFRPGQDTTETSGERPSQVAGAAAAGGAPVVAAPWTALAQIATPPPVRPETVSVETRDEPAPAQSDQPDPALQRAEPPGGGGPKAAGSDSAAQPDGLNLAAAQNPAPAAQGGPPGAPAAPPPRELEGLGLVMLPLPAGEFVLGNPAAPASGPDADEKPLTEIIFASPIWMSRTEITQAQWRAVMDTSLEEHLQEFPIGGNIKPAQAGDNLPMIFMNHEDAAAFAARLNSRERAAGRVPAGFEYRLPTEAEWEYAARAGAPSQPPTPAGDSAPEAAAGPADRSIPAETAAVPPASSARSAPAPRASGPLPAAHPAANAWGLLDLLDGPAEWCADSYRPYPGGGVSDPAELYQKYSGGRGVLRGGGGLAGAAPRATDRTPADKLARLATAGFRVVLAPSLRSAGACIVQEQGGKWALRFAGTCANLYNVLHDGRRFIIVGQDGAVLLSDEGTRWTDASIPGAPTLRGLATNGALYVAVGDGGAIYLSREGTQWTPVESPTRHTLWSVQWCGGLFLATGVQGTLLTSVDGRNWVRQAVPLTVRIFDVAHNGGMFFATADSGNYLTSRDGKAWRAEKFPWPLWTHGVIWAQGRFIALANPACPPTGTNPFIVTSGTGNPGSWSARVPKRSIPDCIRLLRPCLAGNGLIAVGDRGVILTSRDSVAWDKSPAGVTVPLGAVAASKTSAVAVGADGAILTASLEALGLVPTPEEVLLENITDRP